MGRPVANVSGRPPIPSRTQTQWDVQVKDHLSPDASSPEDLGRSNSGIRSFVYDFIHYRTDTCTWRRSWLFRVPLAEIGLLVVTSVASIQK